MSGPHILGVAPRPPLFRVVMAAVCVLAALTPAARAQPQPSPSVQTLFELEAQETNLLADFGPDHPEVIALRQRIELLRRRLNQQVKSGSAKEPPSPPPPEAPAIQPAVHFTPVAPPTDRPAPGILPDLPCLPLEPAKPDAGQKDRLPEPPAETSVAPPTEAPVVATPAVPVASLVAAIFVGIFLHLGVLFLFLRRFGDRVLGRLTAGIAVAPVPQVVIPAAPVPAPPAHRQPEVRPESEAPPLNFVPPPIVALDPTFQEEREMRERERQQQEEAVLQRIFEDNLRLQMALGQG